MNRKHLEAIRKVARALNEKKCADLRKKQLELTETQERINEVEGRAGAQLPAHSVDYQDVHSVRSWSNSADRLSIQLRQQEQLQKKTQNEAYQSASSSFKNLHSIELLMKEQLDQEKKVQNGKDEDLRAELTNLNSTDAFKDNNRKVRPNSEKD